MAVVKIVVQCTASKRARNRSPDCGLESPLYSRNDAIGNIAVMVAGVAVAVSGSRYPYLLVAVGLAGLFFYSSQQIFQQAWVERRSVMRCVGGAASS